MRRAELLHHQDRRRIPTTTTTSEKKTVLLRKLTCISFAADGQQGFVLEGEQPSHAPGGSATWDLHSLMKIYVLKEEKDMGETA